MKSLARRITRRPEPPRELIYLVAPAGAPNYGDELISRTWLRYLARVRPDADVVLDCHTPGQASILLRGLHPRVMFVDTLWRLCNSAKDRGHAEQADAAQIVWQWAADAATTLGTAPLIAEGIDLLGRADTIHLVGGGYINEVWPHHLSLLSAIAAVARKSGARAAATGLGLTPITDPARVQMLRAAAAAFEVFDVRDKESLALLGPHAANASLCGDDAWLALSPDSPSVYAPEHQIPSGIVLCLQSDLAAHFSHAGRTGPEAIASWTGEVLDQWGASGPEITVIEGIPGTDRVIPDLLGSRLAAARFVPFLELWRTGLPAGPDQQWISTRFHPHLLAAAAGASGVALVSEPGYYETKHCSLEDAGSRWQIAHDGLAVAPVPPTAGGFSAADRATRIQDQLALARQIYPR